MSGRKSEWKEEEELGGASLRISTVPTCRNSHYFLLDYKTQKFWHGEKQGFS